MEIDDRFGNIQGKIRLLPTVSEISDSLMDDGLTWKEAVSDLLDGSGDAEIASCICENRDGMAIYAARHRREKGTFISKFRLQIMSLCDFMVGDRVRAHSFVSKSVTSVYAGLRTFIAMCRIPEAY